jgi:hypothetical protein
MAHGESIGDEEYERWAPESILLRTGGQTAANQLHLHLLFAFAVAPRELLSICAKNIEQESGDLCRGADIFLHHCLLTAAQGPSVAETGALALDCQIKSAAAVLCRRLLDVRQWLEETIEKGAYHVHALRDGSLVSKTLLS